MKKILLVTGSLDMGGLETVAMQIVKSSDPQCYKFDFLLYDNKQYFYEKEALKLGCNILRIPQPRKNYFSYYKNIKRIIQDKGPYDIVHTHVYFNSSIVVCAAKKCGVPLCIAHSHSIRRKEDNKLTKKIAYFIMRKILNKYSDKFAACSSQAGRHVFGEKEFGEKGQVILNPVDIKKYSYSLEARNRIRKELKISSEQVVLGQVGRLVEGKNYKFLIDLFNKYQKYHDAVLLIVGEGKLRKELETYTKTLNIFSKVRFTGNREDIPEILSSMDIFVMTSLHEGLGIVLLEAMANGLKCLCEDKAIVDEVKSIKSCKTISGYNVEEWCDMIDKIVNDRQESSRKSQKELEMFSSEVFRDNLIKLYS